MSGCKRQKRFQNDFLSLNKSDAQKNDQKLSLEFGLLKNWKVLYSFKVRHLLFIYCSIIITINGVHQQQ